MLTDAHAHDQNRSKAMSIFCSTALIITLEPVVFGLPGAQPISSNQIIINFVIMIIGGECIWQTPLPPPLMPPPPPPPLPQHHHLRPHPPPHTHIPPRSEAILSDALVSALSRSTFMTGVEADIPHAWRARNHVVYTALFISLSFLPFMVVSNFPTNVSP